jgi:FlaG/FlaF family flagellin (archaellin)
MSNSLKHGNTYIMVGMKMRSIRITKKNDPGVSAVIGIILMVSITVSIGGTIFAYMSGSMLSVTSHPFSPITFTTSPAGDITILQGETKTNMENLEFHINGYEIPNTYTGPLTAGKTISINYLITTSDQYTISDSGSSTVTINEKSTNKIIATYTIAGTIEPISEFVITSESPNDGAIDQPYPALVWSVTIQNTMEKPFQYTIKCSNGEQSTIEKFIERNGIYSIALKKLSQKTQYTITVVAATQSGIRGEKSFTFTTKEETPNLAPKMSKPTPINYAVNQELSLKWTVAITDPEKEPFDWRITCSNGEKTEGTYDTNGVKSLEINHLEYSTTYTIIVYATDMGSKQTTIETYHFSTKEKQGGNQPVIFGKTNPEDKAINQPTAFSWTIGLIDPENDPFSVTIKCSNGQSVEYSSISQGSTLKIELTKLDPSTQYTITVTTIDTLSLRTETQIYTFTTITK